MKPVITIGITSYNRINELERCIGSIKTRYDQDVEILVNEDRSPLSEELRKKIEELAKTSKYHLRFTRNERNLGYDKNLGAIIEKAQGDFIFFLSDDDAMCGDFLDELILFLKQGTDAGVLYAPFVHSVSGLRDRVRGERNFAIAAGEKNAARYIYDSILFSGLIFRKEYIEKYDAARFKNLNYYQVYLFLQMIKKYGGYYFSKPSVIFYGDGENAFGLSESSKETPELANRESAKTNLAFHKGLIKVIRMFDEDEGTRIIDSFAKQYSLHSYTGLSSARREGKKYFKEYWKMMNELDIKLHPITWIYYFSLLMFGEKMDRIMEPIRRKVKGNC